MLLSHHQSEIFCLFFFAFVVSYLFCLVVLFWSACQIAKSLRHLEFSCLQKGEAELGYQWVLFMPLFVTYKRLTLLKLLLFLLLNFSVKYSLTISNIMGKFVFFFTNSGIICQRFSNYLSLPLIFALRIHTLPLLIQYSIVCVRNNRGVKSQIGSSPWKADWRELKKSWT